MATDVILCPHTGQRVHDWFAAMLQLSARVIALAVMLVGLPTVTVVAEPGTARRLKIRAMNRQCSLLLAGVAALSVLTASAAQPVTKTELPDAMLGAWCYAKSWQFPDDDDDVEHLRPAGDVGECGNRGAIQFRKDGFDYDRFGPYGSCQFTLIEFSRHGQPEDHVRPVVWDAEKKEYIKAEPTETPPSDVYLIHATCKATNDKKEVYIGNSALPVQIWSEKYEIQVTDGWLIRWFLPKG
jgi:hypothetical protein